MLSISELFDESTNFILTLVISLPIMIMMWLKGFNDYQREDDEEIAEELKSERLERERPKYRNVQESQK